jgi:flagellar biogenesis protein FliO
MGVRRVTKLTVLLALGLGLAASAGVPAEEPKAAPTPAPAVVAAPVAPSPGVTLAQAPADGLEAAHAEAESAEELNLGWTLLRTFVVLGLVIGIIYLTLNVGLRRLLGIRPMAGGASVVSVLERVTLDQKRALFVVKAANEVLLLGASDQSLSLLTKLDPAEIDRLRAVPERGAPGLTLSPLLQKLLGRKDAPPPPAAD